MNTWPLRGAVMLDIPSQYRPSYRNHARTSSETTHSLDTKELWTRNEWMAAGSGDAHCHPGASEAVGKFTKHVIGDCAASHPTNPAILRHYNLPHLHNLRRQNPPAVRKPFVGIVLERREKELPSRNWQYGNAHHDDVRRDASLGICDHFSREEPGQDPKKPSQAPGSSSRLVIKGHSFPVRHLTQEVFLPRFLDYRASWQPPDLVYDEKLPLNPSAVQQLDIVKTWRRLSFSQAAEILHWEETFKLVLAANLEALLTSSDGVQTKSVEGPTENPCISVRLDPLKVVFDMIQAEDGTKTAFRWFASTENVHRSLLRFLRNQDCFIDPLVSCPGSHPCANIRSSSVKFMGLPKSRMSDMSGPAQAELLWNPPYISFESFDFQVEEGQAFHLRPSFCCALKDLFEDALAKGEISLTYSANVDWLRYDHKVSSFSGTVPVRRRLLETKSNDPSSVYTLDIIVKAQLVENFGAPTLEQTMRTQIRLRVMPKTDQRTLQRDQRFSHHTRDRSLDVITRENLAADETDTKEEIIRDLVTRPPLDADIHNTYSPASLSGHKGVPDIHHYRHGQLEIQANKSSPDYPVDATPDCVDPPRPAPLVVLKSRPSTLKKMRYPHPPTPSDRNSPVPRFDNNAADLEAKYSAWKFAKESKPGRRADYFIDFAATPRQRPRRQLQSSNDGEHVLPSESVERLSCPEELWDDIRSCLYKVRRKRTTATVSHPPLNPPTPPEGETSTILSGKDIHAHNGHKSKRPFFSSDDTTVYPSGGTTSGVDETAEETYQIPAPDGKSRQDELEQQSQEPPLIRRDDALALLLQMRQIHEDERMSLGTNAEAIWFSSENTSQVSLFESLDSGCSDYGTVFIVDDGEEADDEAEAGNVGSGVFD
ncbi:hypothetical protein DTO271G3_3639 [Paecilomyces variotii]|nr:hypothetical protein DTO271G3_3639 [Paecilomyces variotii]